MSRRREEVGPRLLNHFGFIHCFSILVLICIPLAIRGIRRGDVRAHRGNMIGVYVGGILIAGSFALRWGRMLHGWLFGQSPQFGEREGYAPCRLKPAQVPVAASDGIDRLRRNVNFHETVGDAGFVQRREDRGEVGGAGAGFDELRR